MAVDPMRMIMANIHGLYIPVGFRLVQLNKPMEYAGLTYAHSWEYVSVKIEGSFNNAETARTYSFHTGEGDSEVLLVADGLVSYRVNDSLYKVAVGPNEPVRLLTDENLSGIHWAILGPAAAASTGP